MGYIKRRPVYKAAAGSKMVRSAKVAVVYTGNLVAQFVHVVVRSYRSHVSRHQPFLFLPVVRTNEALFIGVRYAVTHHPHVCDGIIHPAAAGVLSFIPPVVAFECTCCGGSTAAGVSRRCIPPPTRSCISFSFINCMHLNGIISCIVSIISCSVKHLRSGSSDRRNISASEVRAMVFKS